MKSKLLLCLFFVAGVLFSTAASAQNRTVTGLVEDEGGAPLAGASVSVGGSATGGVSTGADGRFSISVSASTTSLSVTFVGYDEGVVSLREGVNNYTVTMYAAALEVGTVVVNAGIIQREAATFTGSYKQLTQEQLKEAGSLNVLSALSTLDPSFVIVENNMMGSDPNSLPNVELNGKTSMNVQDLEDEYSVNPNQPHYVLNGFDSSAQEVYDLDINRIASVTLLKDAGATAIYGAKGANGVVVVETIKPKSGELLINYSLNATASFADLSAYNLMNAREKLEFERLTEFYGDVYDPLNGTPYWRRLGLVEQGVDTYWLKYPVRTGISHQHNFVVSGGDDALTYSTTLGYNNNVGVMKGSNRETVNGDIFLQYRAGNVNVSNQMFFNSTTSHAGSYGSFQEWAKMSPYFRPYDDNGVLQPNVNPDALALLEGTGDYQANPLYNASLNTDNVGKSIKFRNNTNVIYQTEIGLRFQVGLSLERNSSTVENWKDSRDTDFRNTDVMRKGTYNYSGSNGWLWNGNIQASYAKTVAEKHNFNIIARAEARNERDWGTGYSVVGLPEGANPNPSMSNGYSQDSKPSYNKSVKRNTTFMGNFNYNYDTRYLFDATLNRDGSTMYGSKKPFTTNWSLGLGWNISREKFAENWGWFDDLRLKGSIGTNANQSADMLSSSLYNYMLGNDYFGQAWQLGEIANPYLDWQKTYKKSVTILATALDERLNVELNYFDNKTDPQTIILTRPPSTGVDGYAVNVGSVNSKGWNATASYIVLRRPADKLMFNVRLNAGHTSQVYDGFGAAFDRLNRELANSIYDVDMSTSTTNEQERQDALDKVADLLNNDTALNRYRDGNDPDDMWAVKSLGIDPATGMEVYLDQSGMPTMAWDYDDERVIASRRAKVHGNLGFTFNYKHFRSSVNFAYSYGGYAMNTALYNKVENIVNAAILNNQDKRALYDRWQKPGDVAQFLSIKRTATAGKLSSRFIQKNNYIEASSIQLGWDFDGTKLLQQTKLKSLVLNVSMNNLFRLGTIKMERGTDYPFAREVIFSLSTSF